MPSRAIAVKSLMESWNFDKLARFDETWKIENHEMDLHACTQKKKSSMHFENNRSESADSFSTRRISSKVHGQYTK